MSHILVKNSLSNLKAAKLNINIPSFISVRSGGDPKWFLEIATTYPSASGTNIAPVYIDNTLNFDTLDEAIANAVSNIAAQIDWEPLVKDNSPPYVTKYVPTGETVSIASNVSINIKDASPAAGIDLSGVKVVINNGTIDIDITNDCKIEGNPLDYNIYWEPPQRLTRHY